MINKVECKLQVVRVKEYDYKYEPRCHTDGMFGDFNFKSEPESFEVLYNLCMGEDKCPILKK